MRTVLIAFTLLIAAGAKGALLQAGEAFPAWELTDHTGKTVRSTDLAGRSYLLWFYPKAMTPGCTAEGQGLRDQFAAFEKKGVVIYGVSFDPPASNARFVAAEAFPFALLSDTDRTLATAVGAADSPSAPAARRISYLIGPDGRVRTAYPTVDPRTHASTVLGDL